MPLPLETPDFIERIQRSLEVPSVEGSSSESSSKGPPLIARVRRGPSPGWWTASFVDVRDVVGFGDTPGVALERAREALGYRVGHRAARLVSVRPIVEGHDDMGETET